MAKVSYAGLKLKTNNEVNTFDFEGNTVEVLQYLPIEDKYGLINIALQRAEENGYYNEVLLDMYFHLYIVYMYTNLTFIDKQKENEMKIYDTLKSNGFIDMVLDKMDENEYQELYEYLVIMGEKRIAYKNSFSGSLDGIFQNLSENANQLSETINNFDPKKYQAVIDFATAANGGRPIPGING